MTLYVLLIQHILYFLIQLPWKSIRDIVEYFYMWKTTDRHLQQKRAKAAEAESRLKQVCSYVNKLIHQTNMSTGVHSKLQ